MKLETYSLYFILVTVAFRLFTSRGTAATEQAPHDDVIGRIVLLKECEGVHVVGTYVLRKKKEENKTPYEVTMPDIYTGDPSRNATLIKLKHDAIIRASRAME
ncbi:hypothetical protein Trydic_g13048 [Trypoxylus dichotomus]